MGALLTEAGGKTRLYVPDDLGEGVALGLSEAQTHYLLHVLRALRGNLVLLFNGRHGEWLARIGTLGKRGAVVECLRLTRAQTPAPDIWLAFAPVKKTPVDFLVQKATELGASHLLAVFTRRTIVGRINAQRMRCNAVEAAQQSGRLSLPTIAEPVGLEELLGMWPAERTLFFCDEGGDGLALAQAVRDRSAPAAILTGPEGGFAPEERASLRERTFVVPASLGPRILRADTAALAALAIWQSIRGDWG